MKPIKNKEGTIIRTELDTNAVAQNILIDYTMVTTGQEKFQTLKYKDGCYVKGGNVLIAKECQRLTNGQVKNQQIQEVIGQIQRITWKEIEVFDTAPVNLICIGNGVLNIDTKELLHHSPDYYFLQKLQWDFIKEKDCPKIKKYLSEVLASEDIDTLQEFIGYCVYRKLPFKKAAILKGDKNTGKTTTINLVIEFIGEENTSSVSLHKIVYDKFAAAGLYGKLLNFYDDLSLKDIKDTGNFKIATGGGYVSAERKFGDQFKFLGITKHLFATNKFQAVIDADDLAYYERWLIFIFENVFEGKNADRNILEKLTTKEEMSGLLNWALEGLKRLLQNGSFSHTKTAEENRAVMEKNSNSISAFIQDCMIEKDGNWIATADLYESYCQYCAKNELPKESQDQFSKTFGKKVLYAVAKQRDANKDGKLHKKVRGWLNIKLGVTFHEGDNTSNTYIPLIFREKKLSNTYNRYEFEKPVTRVTEEPTPKTEILLDFIREKQQQNKKGYNMQEFSNKYSDGIMEKLLKAGDVIEKTPGYLWVL